MFQGETAHLRKELKTQQKTSSSLEQENTSLRDRMRGLQLQVQSTGMHRFDSDFSFHALRILYVKLNGLVSLRLEEN
jgi:hypothetical protein